MAASRPAGIVSGGGLAGALLARRRRAACAGAGPPALRSLALGPLDLSPAFDRLDSLNDLGSTHDVYNQNSHNWALFTHNIFHITDQLDVTLGLRYTNEKKKFDADLRQRQHRLPAQQAALLAVPRPVPRWRRSPAASSASPARAIRPPS